MSRQQVNQNQQQQPTQTQAPDQGQDRDQGPGIQVDPNGEDTVFSTDMIDGDGRSDWILGDGPDAEVTEPGPGQGQGQLPQQPGPGPQQQPTQSGQGYEIRLRTGHVFRGATPDDAAAQAQAHFDRLGSAVYQPAQYQSPSQGQGHQTVQYQEPPASAWSDEEFYRTFATNPRAAMEAFLQHYFGHENPADVVNQSYSVSTQVSDRIAVADFLAANPDFPGTPEAGAILVKRLEADGQDLSQWNLEVAYRQLIREGVLQPVQAQQQQQSTDYRSQYGQGSGQGYQQPQQPQQQGYGQGPQPSAYPYQQQPVPTQFNQPAQPPAPASAPYTSRGRSAPPNGSGYGSPTPGTGSVLGDRDLSIDEFENLSADDMARYITRSRQRRDQGRRQW